MTLDLTKPMECRNGEEVIIYCTDAPGPYTIHGRIKNSGKLQSWSKEGFMYEGESQYSFSLINVPEEPKPPAVYYRLLNEGEKIKDGDEYWYNDEWHKWQLAEYHCYIKDGYPPYRRPLKPFCVEKGFYEI